MALIETFDYRSLRATRIHDGLVCDYRWFDVGSRRVLQLDTYGSKPTSHSRKGESVASDG